MNFFPINQADILARDTWLVALQKLIYVPVAILSAYFSIYFLLPKFLLKKKYVSFFFWALVLCGLNLILAWSLTLFLSQFHDKNAPAFRFPDYAIFQTIVHGLGLGLSISAFAIIIKLLKLRYVKEKENEMLKKQIIATELQMIKTNFHPNFLSASLQNISHMIRANSKQSPVVILKLADLLSYILYDNEKELVALEQEWHMVKEYLDLEKTYYGNRIIANIKECGNLSGVDIAPLILLSLVQNCCEQSLISLQQKLLLDLEIKLVDDQLLFKLACNGYYEVINGISQQDKELKEALRRIELTYPRKHKIESYLENGSVKIILFLELEYSRHKTEKELLEYALA